MKHLYIIGNGFDIYTGLATRYSDFRLWLGNNYPFIYENLQVVYDIDAGGGMILNYNWANWM